LSRAASGAERFVWRGGRTAVADVACVFSRRLPTDLRTLRP
jgi:hypothetical protein